MGTHLSARYKQVLIAVLDIRTQSCFEEQGRETAFEEQERALYLSRHDQVAEEGTGGCRERHDELDRARRLRAVCPG